MNPKPDPSKNPKRSDTPWFIIVLGMLLIVLLTVSTLASILKIVDDTNDKQTYECYYSPPPQYRLLKCEYK